MEIAPEKKSRNEDISNNAHDSIITCRFPESLNFNSATWTIWTAKESNIVSFNTDCLNLSVHQKPVLNMPSEYSICTGIDSLHFKNILHSNSNSFISETKYTETENEQDSACPPNNSKETDLLMLDTLSEKEMAPFRWNLQTESSIANSGVGESVGESLDQQEAEFPLEPEFAEPDMALIQESVSKTDSSENSLVEWQTEPNAGESSSSIRQSLYSQSDQIKQINAEKAVTEFLRVTQLSRRQSGETEPERFVSRDALEWYLSNGKEFLADERFLEAEEEYLRALEIIRDFDSENFEEEESILEDLGEIYLRTNRPESAISLYEKSRELKVTTRIPEKKLLQALLESGAIHEEAGQLSEAELNYRKASELAVSILAADDPFLAQVNEACLKLARAKSTLVSRFCNTELEHLHNQLKETDGNLLTRKGKLSPEDENSGSSAKLADIWHERQQTKTSENNQDLSQSKAFWLWVAGSVAFAFVSIFMIFAPVSHIFESNDKPNGITNSAKKNYSSADGTRNLLLENSMARYDTLDNSWKASRIIRITSPWDLIQLIPGHLRKEAVYFDERTDKIITPDKSCLYNTDGPELSLVKHMWKYASIAEKYWNETRSYPSNFSEIPLPRDSLAYINPFDLKKYTPIIASTNELGFINLKKDIEKGKIWPGQPEPVAGLIFCNNFNNRVFYIRAYDIEKNLLAKSNIGNCYFIQLQNGVNKTKKELHELKSASPVLKAEKHDLRFVLAPNTSAVEQQLNLIGWLVPLFLSAISAWTWVAYKSKQLKNKSQVKDLVLMTGSLIVTLAWLTTALANID